VDYDLTDIPAGYDRSRNHGSEFLDLWMHTLEPYLNCLDLKRILDLGCGTGRFSEALSAHFNAEVIGIDPSKKMLDRAREKARRTHVQFFPSTPSVLLESLPDHVALCEPFEAAGFRLRASEVVKQTIAPNWSVYADKLSARGDSIIVALSEQELESGLALLRRHGLEAVSQTVAEPIDLFVFH
jgi:SAM-dependent methyltransferase